MVFDVKHEEEEHFWRSAVLSSISSPLKSVGGQGNSWQLGRFGRRIKAQTFPLEQTHKQINFSSEDCPSMKMLKSA